MPASTPAPAPEVAEVSAPARLAAAIDAVATTDPDRVAIVTAAGLGADLRQPVSYGTLAGDVAARERRLADSRPIGVVARASGLAPLIALVAASGRQRVPLALVAEDSRDLVGELRDWSVCGNDLEVPRPPQGRTRREFDSSSPQIVVATSGTSGPPKLVEHSWD
jgi:acyl-coenzyme A synthetase/AMP-(fatty) acid ligase